MTEPVQKLSADKHLFAVLDGLPIAVFLVDKRFNVLYLNPTARKMVEFSSPNVGNIGSFFNLVSPEHRSVIKEFLESPPEVHEENSITSYLLRREFRVPVEINVTATPMRDGYIIYACELSRSIPSKHGGMEKAEAYHILVEGSNIAGLLVVNDAFEFVYVNNRFAEMLGTTPSQLIGKDFRPFVHPDDLGIVVGRYATRQEGFKVPAVYEFRAIRVDGEEAVFRIHSTVLLGRDGRVYSVAHVIDVTDEVRSRQLLEESEQKYRILIETMTSGLSVDTPDGKIALVNSELVRMLGYTNESELIGKPITVILNDWTNETVEATFMRRKSGISEQYEAMLRTKSGDLIPVMVSASPLFDRDGHYTGSIAVFTNISELKEAESEVHFLLDLLMHDVGNQLQLVLAGADLLSFASSSEERETATSYIRDGVTRCLDIIGKVRRAEATKIEPPRPINLTTILEQECALLSRQFKVELHIEDIPSTVMVRADSALDHLLRNILENAIKHNPRDDPIIWIKGSSLGDEFLLCISDNGPGLPDSKKKDLFNPSRRYGGVGLHLVTKIARKYGCHISVDDRVKGDPEQGLRICITFPKVDAL